MPIVPIKDGNFLGVDVTIGGRILTALVDTRSMGAVGFTPQSAELVEFDGELQVIGRGRGAAIPETDILGGRLLHDVGVAGHRIVRPFSSIRPLPEHFPTEPILGNVVLRQFRLTIDVAGGWMQFERDSDGPIELPEPRMRVEQGSGARHQAVSAATTASNAPSASATISSSVRSWMGWATTT